MIRAIDPARRRDAYGAVITVHAGGRRWLGFINPGQSYLCSNDPRAHFGLGQADHVDSIHIQWPDGDTAEEIFPGVQVNRVIELRRGQGVIATTPK
jgi:hypothetical protein